MASRTELSQFLADIEKRAYRHARLAVQNDEHAFDIVQDAMLKLVDKYQDKPIEELPLLFHRILHNVINDYHRRQKVRNFWVLPFSLFAGKEDEEDEFDLLSSVENDQSYGKDPALAFNDQETLKLIEEGLARLPQRQREAFLLRYLEENDVATTASIMGCSEGSVKTHCARANASLTDWLNKHGIKGV
ncbi:RNA polymerase sigma factor [Leeia sp. TBRC 13508]|uniref:RNA polymerase sigma factor n=1 Tax=Leeia speluncae TaxID=2884804 RepID=A0ABS8D2R4_9NEIS|nr:RNA polymerase sigma factor [Leeia speluncae]MCB6182477.1 RNA polymerase sigma factor [Leeia speluncae]